MHAQEVNQAMATNAAEELQAVIADQESELQQLLGDLRHVARSMADLSTTGDVTDGVVDTLRWTVDSVRTELQEARQILRGAVDRVSEAAALYRQFG
jgi:hypothetical protein